MLGVARFVLLAVVVSAARRRPQADGDGPSVPGVPGEDYPIFAEIPQTSFSCNGKSQGFYADMETRCQVFHVCAGQSGSVAQQSFLCPNGTIFNKAISTCDWWRKVRCVPSDLSPQATSTPGTTVEGVSRVAGGRRGGKGRQVTGHPGRVRVSKVVKFRNRPENSIRSRESSVKPVRRTKSSSTARINTVSDEPFNVEGEHSERRGNTRFSSPVTEVTIRPRVRYTQSLKHTTTSPIYSLNPIVQLARDSSLLSTFETAASNEDGELSKVTDTISPDVLDRRPVQRFALDGVLPQYNNLSVAENPVLNDNIQKQNVEKDTIQIRYRGDSTAPQIFPVQNENNDDIESINTSTLSTTTKRKEVSQIQDHLRKEESTDVTDGYQSSNSNENSNSVKVGSNLKTSFQTHNKLTERTPPFVRVSSGYSFTPTGKTYHSDENKSKPFRVTTSYAIDNQYQTVDSERRNENTYGSNGETNTPFLSEGSDDGFSKQYLTTNLPNVSEDIMNTQDGSYTPPQNQETHGNITAEKEIQLATNFETTEPAFSPKNPTINQFSSVAPTDSPHTVPDISVKNDDTVRAEIAIPNDLLRHNKVRNRNRYRPQRPVYRSRYSENSRGVYNIKQSPVSITQSVPNYSISSTPNYGSTYDNAISGHYITNSPSGINNFSHQRDTDFQFNREYKAARASNHQPYSVETSTKSISTPEPQDLATYSFTSAQGISGRNPTSPAKPSTVVGISTTAVNPPSIYPSVDLSTISNPFTSFDANQDAVGKLLSVPESAFENSHFALPVFPSQYAFFSSFPHQRTIPFTQPNELPPAIYSTDNTDNSYPTSIDQGGGSIAEESSAGIKTTTFQPSSTFAPKSSITPLLSTVSQQELTSARTNEIDKVHSVFPSLSTISISPSIEAYTESTVVDSSANTQKVTPSRSKSLPKENSVSPPTSSPPEENLSTTSNYLASERDNENLTETSLSPTGSGNGVTPSVSLSSGLSPPKPFLGVNLQTGYVALPDYNQVGSTLFSPQDLFGINNLHRTTEPSIPLHSGPEIVRSISFTLDTLEGLEQFERARSKGLFDR